MSPEDESIDVNEDAELKALEACVNALNKLDDVDPEATHRVIEYLVQRYGEPE